VATYAVKVNGQEYQVEIDDPRAEPVQVVVNGQAFEVSVTEQQSQPRRSRTTRVLPEEELDVYVPTLASAYVEATAVPEDSAAATPPASVPEGAGLQITAPMPGKILDIAVQEGSRVKQGEVLCNLEAMKMKSPIRSTAAGTVARILISEGQNVNFGDVLFVLQ
jgi:biotin carboxyl carrier protein